MDSNTAAPADNAACIHHIRPFLTVVDAVWRCVVLFNLTEVIFTDYVTLKKSSKKKERPEMILLDFLTTVLELYSVCMLLIFPVLGHD